MRSLEDMVGLISQCSDGSEKIVIYGDKAKEMSDDLFKVFPKYNLNYMLTDTPDKSFYNQKGTLMIYTGEKLK